MKIEGTKLSMVRGDTEYIMVTCKNYTFQEGEDKVEMTVRKTANDPKKLIYKVIEDFEDGKANIKIEPEDTSRLAPGEYKYDIQVTFSNGDVKTIIPCSVLSIKQEVTYG